MERIVRGSRVSLQDQILRSLVSDISQGRLQPGDQLPTERQLAEQTGASLAPVRVALKQLEAAGYVTRTQGRGTFVAESALKYQLRLMSSSTDALRRAGVDFEVEVADQSLGAPAAEAAKNLGLKPQEEAFHLLRTISIGGSPSMLLDSWVNTSYIGDLIGDDIFERGGSLYAVLAKNGVVQHHASGRVGVHYLGDWEADLLAMPFGAVVLALTSVTFTVDGQAIDYSRGLYDPSRFAFELDQSLVS